MKSIRDLLLHELRDLHDAEEQILEALPKMAKAASDEKLVAAFEEHLEETKEHVRRLDWAFGELGAQKENVTCEGLRGLIKEGEEIIKKDADPLVKDAALIGAAQRVEHYEMAAYGTARALADELGEKDVAKRLDETLSEESLADDKLTKIATGGLISRGVNEAAPKAG